nr:reverse transcriptase domain-containing protein [Tanacetum cinerariifolium]
MFKQLHINITLADALILIPKYQKMLKALLSNKEKLLELENTPLNENCSVVILKKLPEKLGDPGKFLISYGFSELKCKALADLGASINLMQLSVWKKLEIEYFLNHDPTKEMDSILEDSVDKYNLADPNDNLFDTIPEIFTDEHTLDYSSPPLYDEYDDDLFKLESDNDDAYNDPFNSKEDKIKESKLLINELDLPRSITIQAAPDKNVKKIAISHASLILEDLNPPLYELPFHKEVLWSETLLFFHPKMRKKFSNLGFSLLK